MADTASTVFKIIKPEVGASSNTWGTKNNLWVDAFENLLLDSGGKITTTGTAAAYAFTPSHTLTTALADGLRVLVKIHVGNTPGACTFNYNGLGAQSIKKLIDGTPTDPAADDLPLNHYVDLIYVAATADWILLNPVLNVSTFAKTLLDDATATAALATLGIASGTYTPTLTNTTNIASSTPVVTNYLRIGNVVHVGGQFTADATAAGVALLEMSLPIASDLTTTDIGGVGVSPNSSGVEVARIIGNATNNTAAVRWIAINTGSQLWGFTFTYRVV